MAASGEGGIAGRIRCAKPLGFSELGDPRELSLFSEGRERERGERQSTYTYRTEGRAVMSSCSYVVAVRDD